LSLNTQIAIQEATDTAEARRTAVALAGIQSFDETLAGQVALVVTEAAKNLLKHAGGGHIILRPLDFGDAAGIEMLALDKGPGIADLGRSFADGYSTAGTPGNGLGAIARLSAAHDIYTRPGQGTALMAQIWRAAARRVTPVPSPRFQIGAICTPLAGETACGDQWTWQERPAGLRVTLADGLGHGMFAADAARAAILAAHANPNGPVAALVEKIHASLRATRGAAVAVAEIDSQAQVLRFVGLGNISAAILPESGPLRRCVSNAGTAGLQARTITEFSYPWQPRSLLIMHSDGLQTHWSLDQYPGLTERHPSVIAGVLYRDYSRGRDDVTVVVARETRPGRDTFYPER
jgi:anti-sigma regulatory factor (Ser/Thr protein kinase)